MAKQLAGQFGAQLEGNHLRPFHTDNRGNDLSCHQSPLVSLTTTFSSTVLSPAGVFGELEVCKFSVNAASAEKGGGYDEPFKRMV
jgi:hypothetical protein